MRSSDLPTELVLLVNRHKRVKIQCLLADEMFHKLIKKEEQHPDYKTIQISSNQFDNFIYTEYSVISTKTNKELGKFRSLQNKDELYIMSSGDAEFFNRTVLQILQKLYPKVLFAFIHSNGIYEILSDFETAQNIQLKYKSAIKKQLFGFSPKTEREWEVYKKNRDYPTFREAFQEAKNNDLWIDNIKIFHGSNAQRPSIQFSIYRKGLVSMDKGVFDILFTNVIYPIMKRSKERREQFSHRSREEQPDKKPKPIIVKFRKNVFEKKETREEFSKILEKYTHCNYSIMHSGNSHVYLSILDKNDNSSFSVRTYGTDSLLLIPQIKTTSLALMRFSEFLTSSFYEGVIQDFEQEARPIISLRV